jgi:hypothetical protein
LVPKPLAVVVLDYITRVNALAPRTDDAEGPRLTNAQSCAICSLDNNRYVLDHLIPLELGGDNTIENLWAEAASPKSGFHEKDLVENYLHIQVCSGAMTLDEAQKIIATDWLSVWRKTGGGRRELPAGGPSSLRRVVYKIVVIQP